MAEHFLDTYQRFGFGVIINHGIDRELTRDIFNASKQFHGLPMAKKMEIALNKLHRGFIANNTSTEVHSKFGQVEAPNQSESFMIMREDPPDHPDVLAGCYLAGANQWPAFPGFQKTVMAYHDAMAQLGNKLMQIACLALKSKPEAVMPAFERPTTWLRLLHYPPKSNSSPASQFGSAPHTDFGCITILAQDEVGGLQVLSPSQQWIDVPSVEGGLVVNVGDMLHRWSNGILRSTPHRVINPVGVERYSCPFFFDPHVNTEISPLTPCTSITSPARFDTIHFGDFLRTELQSSYVQHQQ